MKPQNIGTFAALLGTILLLTTIVAPTVNAQESVQASVSVNITRELTSIGDPTIRILISAFAIGDPNPLTGRGTVTGIGDPHIDIAVGDPNQFGLTGAVEPDTRIVRLSGFVTFAVDPRLIGTPVSLIGDPNSRSISFSLGSDTFTGIGNVVV